MKHDRSFAFLNSFNVLEARWTSEQTTATTRAGYEQVLAELPARHCHRLLDNRRKSHLMWDELTEWMATDWYPRAHRAGLRHHAVVFANNFLGHRATEVVLARFADGQQLGYESEAAARRVLPVLRATHRPLLLVPRDVAVAGPPRRVLVAVDGGPFIPNAASRALAPLLAAWAATYTLTHARAQAEPRVQAPGQLALANVRASGPRQPRFRPRKQLFHCFNLLLRNSRYLERFSRCCTGCSDATLRVSALNDNR